MGYAEHPYWFIYGGIGLIFGSLMGAAHAADPDHAEVLGPRAHLLASTLFGVLTGVLWLPLLAAYVLLWRRE